MDSLDDHHYTVNKFLLTCVGLWPYERTRFTYVKRVSYLLIVMSAIMLQVRSLLYFEVLSTNIVFDAVTNITFTVTILVKHLLYLCNLKGVMQVLDMIRADWRRINDPYEMRILLKNADNGKLLSTVLTAGIYVMIMSYVTFMITMTGATNSTATTDDYMVYSRLKLIYTKNDEKYYLLSLMHTYIVVFIGLMALGGTETTTVLCSHHGFAILQILRHRIRKAFNDDEMDVIPSKKDRSTIAKIIDVVITHVRIIRYKQLVNDSILMGYFSLIVLGITSLSLNLLRFSYAVQRFRKLTQIFPMAALIVGHFLYIGLTNHMGQMVINHGAEFFADTYTGTWYRATVSAQKLLLFIMCHSIKDIVFVFGGIFRPSYAGMTVMIKLSISYLMVMYSLEI